MKKFLLVLFVVLLGGCATNGYKQFYKPELTPQQLQSFSLLPKDGEPIVVETEAINTGVHQAFSKGYWVIGSSAFNGPLESVQRAVDFGKTLGATYIVMGHLYRETRTINSVISMPTSSTTYTSGTAYSGTSFANYSGASTTYGSTLIPISRQQERYDMTAVFLAKPTVIPKIGIRYGSLTPEMRKKLERNTGIYVAVVVEGSPAFDANILEGDVILSIDGVSTPSENEASKVIADAQPVNGLYHFLINRNGKELIVPVKPR